MGVGPGWRCLEVGGGGGSVAAWLSERVKPDGHVLATDIDPRFLVTLKLSNVEARKHDILNDELPEGAFDLVHARAVLEHLPARQEALRRLVTTLTPGGWLLVEDADFVSFVPGSGDDNADGALFRKCWAAIQAARGAQGAAADYGRQLYGAFLAQDLVDVGAEGRVAVAQGGSALARIPRLTAEQLQEVMLRAELVSDQELQRYFALLDDPGFTWLMPIMIAVWGRRPRAGRHGFVSPIALRAITRQSIGVLKWG